MRLKMRKRDIALLMILAGGILLSFALSYIVYLSEADKVKREFYALSSDRAELIENIALDNISALESLGDLFASSVSVERDEFSTFVKGLLERRPSIVEFRWLPRVTDDSRHAFEEAAGKEGLSGFEIKDIDGSGAYLRSTRRSEYFPVYYVESSPRRGIKGTDIVGFDAASIPERREAMNRAGDTGRPVATQDVADYSKAQPLEIKSATRVFLPIYRNKATRSNADRSREDLTGFVALIQRTDEMIDEALRLLAGVGIDIYIYDDSAGAEEGPLSVHRSELHDASHDLPPGRAGNRMGQGLAWSKRFDMAGRNWSIVCVPCKAFYSSHSIIMPWVLLATGIILSLVMFKYIWDISNREALVSVLVEERTAKLHESERALMVANKEWFDTFNSISDFVFILDMESRVVKVNRAFLVALKLKPEDVLGKKCYEVVHKKDSPWPGCPHQKTVSDNLPHTAEVEDPGLGLPLLVTTSPILNEKGEAVGSVHIAQDITERRELDENLRASEARLRSMIEVTGQIGWTTLADGAVEDIPGWRKFTGQSPEEVRGWAWLNAIHPDDRERTAKVWEKAVATRTMYETEYRIRRHDGVYRYFLARGVPSLKEDGAIREWVGTCVDITTRREFEEAMRLTRFSIDHVADSVFWMREDSKIIDVNEAAVNELGYSREELLSKSIPDIDIKHDKARWPDTWHQLKSKGKLSFESIHKTKAGKLVPVEIAANFISFGDRDIVCAIARDVTERKRIELALKYSEEHMRTIFQEAPLGIALIDSLTGHIYEVNPKFAEIAGRSQEDMVSIDWIRITHPDDIRRELDNMALMNAGKTRGFGMSKRYIRPDKSIVWINMTIAPLDVADKAHPRHLCMIEDITDRKKIEESLAESQERFRAFMENSPAIAWMKDEEGRHVFVNRSFQMYHGLKLENVLGKTDFDVWPEDVAQKFRENDLAVLSSGRTVEVFEETVDAKGVHSHWQNIKFIVTDASGMRYVAGFGIDITRRKRIEEALLASQASYRAIFEAANDAIFIKDADSYRITDANKKACEIFGRDWDELVKVGLEELCTKSAAHSFVRLKEYFDKAKEGRPQIFEWPVRDKNGKEFWVEISVRRAEIGGVTRLLSVMRDITERRRVMDMKLDFMSMVSHELRTPLGVIKEGLALALESRPDRLSAKQKDLLNISKANADRLARLISHVLDFQKIDAGRMEYKLENNDINALVTEIRDHMASLVSKKGLELEVRLGKVPRATRFDRDRIFEVLMNLVSNAIKFTDKGRIEIATEVKSGYALVSVSDTGKGIKAEDMSKLFQRFSQLERRPGGTGLGLAIAKEVVEAHKGKIWAESVVGKGSVFYFTIPI